MIETKGKKYIGFGYPPVNQFVIPPQPAHPSLPLLLPIDFVAAGAAAAAVSMA